MEDFKPLDLFGDGIAQKINQLIWKVKCQILIRIHTQISI